MTENTLNQFVGLTQATNDRRSVDSGEEPHKMTMPTVKMIRESCQAAYGITDQDFFSRRRGGGGRKPKTKQNKQLVAFTGSRKRRPPVTIAKYAECRQVAAYLCREMTIKSFLELERLLGKDHSTLVYAVGKIERDILTKPDLADKIEKIRADIKTRLTK